MFLVVFKTRQKSKAFVYSKLRLVDILYCNRGIKQIDQLPYSQLTFLPLISAGLGDENTCPVHSPFVLLGVRANIDFNWR